MKAHKFLYRKFNTKCITFAPKSYFEADSSIDWSNKFLKLIYKRGIRECI